MPNMRPFPPTHGVIVPEDVQFIKDWMPELSVLFVFVGIHATFYMLSTYLLFKEGLRDSGSRLFLFICTTAMFLISLAHSSATISTPLAAMNLLAINTTAEDITRITDRAVALKITGNVLLRANFALSDTVVVWPCLSGTYLAVAINTGFAVVQILHPTPDVGSHPETSLELTLPLFITNVTATGLMGWKAWTHREYVCDSFLRRRHKSRAELALLLLLESGLAYCAIWILVMAASLGALPGLERSTLLNTLCSICGTYPTFIVIMVGLQRSSVDSVLAGNSALVPLTPGRWSGASKSMSAGLKAKFLWRERENLYGTNGNGEGQNADEQYSAFMMPMSPTRQSWPLAVPPTGPPRQMSKRASSPPGAPAFGRLVRVPERSSSLVPSMGSPGASMVSPGPSSSMMTPLPASPMPYAAMSPRSTFSALDPMSDVPLMSSGYGGHSSQSSYGGHSRSSSDAPLLGPGNGMHSRSSSDAPLLGSYNDNRNSMEETSFLDMASSDGGHTSTPAGRFVEFPTPAPTFARPDFPEASARKKDTYRLSYPTMAWTDSQRASVKDSKKGFVRLSTVDEA
ncbi:hypothetical protein K523DRAFT_363555 [Schizophyllum commune Tattone D]|nr:hypothetical protein K523DRAFT_363555 [Schizophyllum commune Tattone D]